MSEDPVYFAPRWKEELVCNFDGHQAVVEFTMGIAAAYFPTEAKWRASNPPPWAAEKWERIRSALEAWCERSGYPLYVVDNTWVSFVEKPDE